MLSWSSWLEVFVLFIFATRNIGQLHEPFDAREATVAQVHESLFSGMTTCREVVSSFIARIECLNPEINAIISLNPEALDIADSLDEAIARGNVTGTLFCVPILLKDNYDATPMNTTGGSLALKHSKPTKDAPSVAVLRKAGAVILGKVNLQEMALEGLSVSSLGGQTINPYDSTRTPGGSSGGTGAAIAASLAVLGTGTDTVNSLRSPASANSLYSFRPTRGLISRAGVVPISFTQDTVGAIGRSLVDIATALSVMASVGSDCLDNATMVTPQSLQDFDYTTALSAGALHGVRLGLLEGFFNRTPGDETTPVNNAMSAIISMLESAGASVIPITDTTTYNATAIQAAYDVQQDEYRETLTAYLQSPHLIGPRPHSMPELYLNTTDFLVIPQQYTYINTALTSSTSNKTYTTKLAGIRNLTSHLAHTITSNNLTALIYPEQKNLVVPVGSPSQSGRNGILAALTGSPVITIPIGFGPPTRTAPIGVPIGMEILGLPWTENELLHVAKLIDDRVRARRPPRMAERMVEVTTFYTAVPSVVSNRKNIDVDAYPLGVLSS